MHIEKDYQLKECQLLGIVCLSKEILYCEEQETRSSFENLRVSEYRDMADTTYELVWV